MKEETNKITAMQADGCEQLVKTRNITIIDERVVLEKQFRVFGTFEEPLFLAKDVAEWIEYSKDGKGNYNVASMISSVDDDEKIKIFTNLNNSKVGSNTWFLTEDGLYEVLMQSRKPIAKKFKKEVKKILKEIRVTGSYNSKDTDLSVEIIKQTLTNPKSIIEMCNNWQKDIEAKEAAEQKLLETTKELESTSKGLQDAEGKIERQKPYVDFSVHVMKSDKIISMATMAKLLCDNGINIGRNNLYKLLRDKKVLGENNEPYQRFVDLGIFKVKENEVKTKYGTHKINITLYVTGKGQVWINKFVKKFYVGDPCNGV